MNFQPDRTALQVKSHSVSCGDQRQADCLPPDDGEMSVPIPDQFAVVDDESINWLVRQIVERRAYRDRVEAWAAKEAARAKHEEEFFVQRYGAQLRQWTERQISTQRGKRKSINLPGGTVGFRHVAPKLVVENPTAVLLWAKDNCPDAILIKEDISKSTLNDHVASTGELPDGTRMEPGGDMFYIK